MAQEQNDTGPDLRARLKEQIQAGDPEREATDTAERAVA